MQMRRRMIILILAAPAGFAQDAASIMARVAANVGEAVEARRQYVYQQTVRVSLIKKNGQIARRERLQYTVVPSPTGTEKKLVSLQGEYRKGKQSLTYSALGDHQDDGIDAGLLQALTGVLVDEKNSRDGIPPDLFPLRSRVLPAYAFTSKGEFEYQGRRTYRIGFEPVHADCRVQLGKEADGEKEDCEDEPWMGEAWIDAAELQPLRIDTHLAPKVPWAIRTFLGTNLRQTGFAITYQRVAEGVWFPATYGTEFQIDVLFLYKRTITLNLESSGFQRTDAASKIEYALPLPIQ
jgi:hypothetical protein